jgi:hypothetical protein
MVDGMECHEAVKINNKACYGKEIRVTIRDPEFPVSMPFIGFFLGKTNHPLEALSPEPSFAHPATNNMIRRIL